MPLRAGDEDIVARARALSALVKLVVLVSAHVWGVGVHSGTEIAENDQRFGLAGVLKGDTRFRAFLGDEIFVFGEVG